MFGDFNARADERDSLIFFFFSAFVWAEVEEWMKEIRQRDYETETTP